MTKTEPASREASSVSLDTPSDRGAGKRIYKGGGSFEEPGEVVLGRTLPSLMDEACRDFPNPKAFNQWNGKSWDSLSMHDFRFRSEALALGLLELKLARGDRVCLFMRSDLFFGLADMGCLVGGLIDVPIYLSHTPETIRYVLRHAEARALIVSDLELLEQLIPVLGDLLQLRSIIVAEPAEENVTTSPFLAHRGIDLLTMEQVIGKGRRCLGEDPEAAEQLKSEIHPHDLATIVYTSGTTGRPKGVMLTHENISFNVLASFTSLENVERREDDAAISFLPLTHIFARMMHYGYLNQGVSVYFSTPEDLGRHLKMVRPTIFATVPRMLEKVYDRILQKEREMGGVRRRIFRWALALARRYDLGGGRNPSGLQWSLADRLVFSKWRAALGGRVRFITCGGAALRADVANLFAAAGIRILQGYGLTETSPVITVNRPSLNRAGTVGVPLAGVEVAVAEDGEILSRGPHIMKGYYRNPQATRESIDAEGWFHTGDVGAFTKEGFLRITDRKKNLFKLSTGKYVMPEPLAQRLQQDPLVDQAIVVGAGRKFCAVLIFPDMANLAANAASHGLDPNLAPAQLLQHPHLADYFERLVEGSNRGLPHWSTIKRFALIPRTLSVENGFLTPTLKVRRSEVTARFTQEIESLYADAPSKGFQAPD
ncbi:MAG: AMP-dependent synthetase/ligase [Acidobacteriota bacterium]